MEDMGGGEGDDPEADDEVPTVRTHLRAGRSWGARVEDLRSAEDLAADANGHEEGAEDEGNPDHSFTFLP